MFDPCITHQIQKASQVFSLRGFFSLIAWSGEAVALCARAFLFGLPGAGLLYCSMFVVALNEMRGAA